MSRFVNQAIKSVRKNKNVLGILDYLKGDVPKKSVEPSIPKQAIPKIKDEMPPPASAKKETERSINYETDVKPRGKELDASARKSTAAPGPDLNYKEINKKPIKKRKPKDEVEEILLELGFD